MRLTKSEFMDGHVCHKRVIYQRAGIPSKRDDNKMLEELAANGQIIHSLFRQLHHSALMGASLEKLIAEAPMRAFEVPLAVDGFEARADMISVDANTITLREVKSEAIPRTEDGSAAPIFNLRGDVSAVYADLVSDVTYQALILEAMLATMQPERVRPWNIRYELVLLNPDYPTPAELLRSTFTVYKGTLEHTETPKSSQLLRMFLRVDVTEAVRRMMPRIDAERREMHRKIEQQEPPVLTSACKSCQYRSTIYGEEPNGFLGCWQELTFATPHILNIPNVHTVKINGEDAVRVLAAQGKATVSDIPVDALRPGYNGMQARVARALITGEAQQLPELVDILSACAAPHAFFDVEAFTGPLSLWQGGHPYEIAAFQWSCHMMDEHGHLEHRAWLYEEQDHPAAAFLTSMHAVLSSAGTIYIWSGYERTAVSHALEAVVTQRQELDPATEEWARAFIDSSNPNVIDMLELAQKYYAHPGARGSNSIKHVLDGIWAQHHRLYMQQFPEYYERHEGFVSSPYMTLPVNYESARLATIRDGTEAVIAYQDMLHGTGRRHAHVRDNLRHALLEYCKLDTAAMVIIYQEWMGR